MRQSIKFLIFIMSILMLVPLLGCTGSGEGEATTTPSNPESTSDAPDTDAPETQTPETDPPAVEDDEWSALRKKAEDSGIKVLFVGDSLTHYNDMPMIFKAMCQAAGKNVTVAAQTKGGTGIAMYREDAALWQTVSNRITSEKWDIVIFQPNRNQPVMPEHFPYYPWKEYAAAKDVVELIKSVSAIPLQYSSIGVNKGYVTREGITKRMTRLEHTNLVTAYNAAVSEMLGTRAVYVGATFNKFIEENPKYNLYHTDNSHPSPMGSYLIAADFYTVIFGTSPADIDYTNGLDAEVAAKLRATAAMLLDYAPTDKAEIKFVEEEKKEKGTLVFGAHSFSGVAAEGKSSVFDVTEDNKTISYTYKSGDGILYSFATLDGKPVSGNSIIFEADVTIGKYCGSKNPTAGLQLIDEKGKTYRLYLRTTGGNITGTDSSTATFHIRTDHDNSATRTDKGSFSNKIKLRLEVTPDSMTLYTDGQLYMKITYDGTEFYDGTKTNKMTYDGSDVQLGLVTCYADTKFENVVIK